MDYIYSAVYNRNPLSKYYASMGSYRPDKIIISDHSDTIPNEGRFNSNYKPFLFENSEEYNG